MSLVVFTALCGMVLAPGHIHPLLAFTAILCIAVGAGASGALNMWLERDTDALMSRTKERPLPQQRIHPDSALAFGLILAIGSVLLMDLAINHLAAFWLAFTIVFYVIVYTYFLKPRTDQNIVVGGLSGALPPLIGWVSVTGEHALQPWLMVSLIFFWTPPHFWSLALYRHDDYARARIPMLPLTKGLKATKKAILSYTIFLGLLSITPTFFGYHSLYYGAFAGLLSLVFIRDAIQLYRSDNPKTGMRFFGYSILYLFAIFLAMLIDRWIF